MSGGSRAAPGTGLGLASTHSVVEQHHGRLRVEDRDRTVQTVSELLDARVEPGAGFDSLVAAPGAMS